MCVRRSHAAGDVGNSISRWSWPLEIRIRGLVHGVVLVRSRSNHRYECTVPTDGFVNLPSMLGVCRSVKELLSQSLRWQTFDTVPRKDKHTR